VAWWKDCPNKDPAAVAHYRVLEENIQKELKIATRGTSQKG